MRSETLTLSTGDEPTVIDLTAACGLFVDTESDGLLNVFVPHATAGQAIIETGAGSAAARWPLAAPAWITGSRPRSRAAGFRRAIGDRAGRGRALATGHLAVDLPGRHERRQPRPHCSAELPRRLTGLAAEGVAG
jgi:hypothetical protein